MRSVGVEVEASWAVGTSMRALEMSSCNEDEANADAASEAESESE